MVRSKINSSTIQRYTVTSKLAAILTLQCSLFECCDLQDESTDEHFGAERHGGILDAVLQGRTSRTQLHVLGVVLHGGEGHPGLSEDSVVRPVSVPSVLSPHLFFQGRFRGRHNSTGHSLRRS